MNALAGIVSFDGGPVAPALVEAMAAAMAHRGPVVAARRHGSRVLFFHGRVDNRDELRRQAGARATSPDEGSDEALVLRAHDTWGADCVSRIEGDFAFAIWDERTRELLCARDRLGHKPFFYGTSGTWFAFASEPQALLALPWIGRQPNMDFVAELVAGEWHTRDETLWSGVLRLPAAHRLRASPRGLARDVYWRPQPDERFGSRGDEELAAVYRDLLEESVVRAARASGPLAVEVSGGLDSSAVLAVAERLRREGRLEAGGLVPMTLAATLPAADEREWARAAAAHLEVALHEVPVSVHPDEFYADRARQYADFPGFPNAWMRWDLLREASRRGCAVVLTGEGGDAWLDGTRAYYAQELARRRWRGLAQCFAADARSHGLPRATAWLLRHGVLGLLSPAERPRGGEVPWLSAELWERLQARRRRERSGAAGLPPHRELYAALDDAFSAHVLESIERVAAACGVELRHPLQDFRLVELAFSMPARTRLRGATHKYLHRRALRGMLPDAVLERTTKADFSPLILAQLRPLEAELADRFRSARPSWVKPDGVRLLFAALERGPDVWPMWPLWGMHGCDLALRAREVAE